MPRYNFAFPSLKQYTHSFVLFVSPNFFHPCFLFIRSIAFLFFSFFPFFNSLIWLFNFQGLSQISNSIHPILDIFFLLRIHANLLPFFFFSVIFIHFPIQHLPLSVSVNFFYSILPDPASRSFLPLITAINLITPRPLIISLLQTLFPPLVLESFIISGRKEVKIWVNLRERERGGL